MRGLLGLETCNFALFYHIGLVVCFTSVAVTAKTPGPSQIRRQNTATFPAAGFVVNLGLGGSRCHHWPWRCLAAAACLSISSQILKFACPNGYSW